MEFDMSFGGRGSKPRKRAGGEPFRLLLIADLSGRAWKRARGDTAPLGKPFPVDAEAVDAAFTKLTVAVPVAGLDGESGEVLGVHGLDDLHPDRLLARVPALAEALRLRKALAGPSPGVATLDEAEQWLAAEVARAGAPRVSAPASTSAPKTPAPAAASSESAGDTLSRLLGRAPSADSPVESAPAVSNPLGRLLESITRAHVSPDPGPRRTQLLGAVDEVLTARLRAVLAAPSFRAVEGAWRAVERVVRTLDTDSELRVFLLDACRDDLVEAARVSDNDLHNSALHRLLVSDDRPFALCAIDEAFGLAMPDLQLLAVVGAIVAHGGGALLAGAAPSLLGCDTLAAVADPSRWKAPAAAPETAFWVALRESPLARTIGLALPRVLARLPYGKKTDPIESFPFEELAPREDAAAAAHVWSGAAFAVAEAFGAAFRADGWSLDPSAHLERDDFPAHTFDDEGETRLYPAAEVALGERAGAAIEVYGLTALLARRDRGAVRLRDASSIASPAHPLAGPWAGDED